MFGLMVLGAAALYLGLMFLVVRWAWRKGRGNGGSVGKASAFAALGFLLVYLPVFWNHIPVLLAHRAMCAKDAGFTAYVAPEQWRQQNRDRLAGLKGEDLTKMSKRHEMPEGFSRYEHFAGLLATEERTVRQPLFGIVVYRIEDRVRDVRNGQLVSTYVDYRVGHREDIRLWFGGYGCIADDDPNDPSDLRQRFYFQLQEEFK